MKIRNIPFIRIFIKLFDYKSKDERKTYVIDFLILLFLNIVIAILIFRFQVYFSDYLTFVIIGLVALFLLQFMSMSARRLNAINETPLLSLLSLTLVGVIYVFFLCIFEYKVDTSSFKKGLKFLNQNPHVTATVGFLLLIITSPIILIITLIPLELFREAVFGDFAIKIDKDISHYDYYKENVRNAERQVPELSEFSDASELHFAYQKTLTGFFIGVESESINLYVTYENNYEVAKEEMNTKYESSFLDEERHDLMFIDFTYRDYYLRFVKYEDYIRADSFMMIGLNDEKKTISYHYFSEFDLDMLSYRGYMTSRVDIKTQEMNDFLDRHFYWY